MIEIAGTDADVVLRRRPREAVALFKVEVAENPELGHSAISISGFRNLEADLLSTPQAATPSCH
jgi:hypothetical protein